MKNQIFLQNYQHLQYGITCNKLIDLNFASITWCEKDDSHFFNHALVDKKISDRELMTIEKELVSLDRKPAIYFENSNNLRPLTKFFTTRGYQKTWEDQWLFHSGEGIDASRFDSISKVSTKAQLKIFLETFDRCYQKDDPQNPYGELGNYLKTARDSWLRHAQSGKIEYFIVYKGKIPVAVSSLTNFAGIGYISNVGSLREVRGEGFGKMASLFCVRQSVANGNQAHALATEGGSYPHQFYENIGFKTKFSALGLMKGK